MSEHLDRDPVAWRRQELGEWIYYATPAWTDAEPLYAAPPVQQAAHPATQEPFCYVNPRDFERLKDDKWAVVEVSAFEAKNGNVPLYAAPNAAPQELVGEIVGLTGGDVTTAVLAWCKYQPPIGTKLYAAPPVQHAAPSPLGGLTEILAEYDEIVNDRLDSRDVEADFVMRGSDWREIRKAVAAPSAEPQDVQALMDTEFELGRQRGDKEATERAACQAKTNYAAGKLVGGSSEVDRESDWTKGEPSVTGWYWYRGDYDASSKDVQPVVVYVEKGKAYQPFMDYDEELSYFTGEWAGPIAPPSAEPHDGLEYIRLVARQDAMKFLEGTECAEDVVRVVLDAIRAAAGATEQSEPQDGLDAERLYQLARNYGCTRLSQLLDIDYKVAMDICKRAGMYQNEVRAAASQEGKP